MRPRFFAPFSLGQRSCIGRQLALVEAMTTLREILMLFELKEVTKYSIEANENSLTKYMKENLKGV